jgi:hypothetical protein
MSDQLADPNLAGSTAITIPSSNVPSSRDLRVTVFWVLSIVLSLSAALVGILAKQWIREYQRDIAESSKEALSRRQLRYESLQYWKVPQIIASLPVLIELAVVLFLLGMIDFLWKLDKVLFAIVTTAISLILAFVILTTILPTIFYPTRIPQFHKTWFVIDPSSILPCAYRSPQANAFRTLLSPILYPVFAALWRPVTVLAGLFLWSDPLVTWKDLENYATGSSVLHFHNAMKWIRDNLINNPWATSHFFRAVQNSNYGYKLCPASLSLCRSHANTLPSIVWKSSELAALNSNTLVESLVRTIQLRSCPSCKPPEDYEEIYSELWYHIDRSKDLPTGTFIFIF